MVYRPSNQSYSLPVIQGQEANPHPVSSSDIGNLYSVALGQALTVVAASDKPRQVTLYNVGSFPLIIATQNRTFPTGLRLGVGDVHQLISSTEIWVAAPPVDSDGVLYVPYAYVSVAVAN